MEEKKKRIMTTADKLSTSIMNALCNNIIVQMYCIKTNPRIEKKNRVFWIFGRCIRIETKYR